MKIQVGAKNWKRFLVLAVCLAAAWCSLISEAVARPTTAEQAGKVVANWLALDPQPLKARMGREFKKVQTFTDGSGNPAYHVVYLNPAGLVFLPADDLVEPIVGFAPTATAYHPYPANPLAALVSRDLTGRVLKARQAARKLAEKEEAAPVGPWRKAQLKWQRLENPAADRSDLGLPGVSEERVPPFLKSKWGQGPVGGGYCYDYYTPNNFPCGCNATAMAQLMLHWMYPQVGVGTPIFQITVDGVTQVEALLGGDGAGGAYNWGSMPLDPANTALTDDQREAIGVLTHDAGVASNMSYKANESAAFPADSAQALAATFKYSNVMSGWNNDANLPAKELLNMINPNLDAGFPVLLGLMEPPPSQTLGAHMVACDGYGYNADTLYHHLNLGWEGNQDAWYNLPTVDTADITFASVFFCMYNVYPAGTGEIISGRVQDKDGNPVSGALVAAEDESGHTFSCTTNERGIYYLVLPPGASYQVSARYQGRTCGFTERVTVNASVNNSTATGNIWGLDFGPVSFKGMGFLPGHNKSGAYDVSPDGTVVVGSSANFISPYDYDMRAYSYRIASGEKANLGTLSDYSWASGVSKNGELIAGTSGAYGFRWSAATGMVALFSYPYARPISRGVSGDGKVIAGDSINTSPRAVRWVAPGYAMSDLPLGFPPDQWFEVKAMSTDGLTFVGSSNYEVFCWTEAKGRVDLGKPQGSHRADPTGVSGNGSAIVGRSEYTSVPCYRWFRWTAAAGMTDLGAPQGFSSILPYGVSENGSLIVGTSINVLYNLYSALIWDARHGWRVLQDVLVNQYQVGAVAGWTLSGCVAISDNGMVIVGSGWNPAGQWEGWVVRFGPEAGWNFESKSLSHITELLLGE